MTLAAMTRSFLLAGFGLLLSVPAAAQTPPPLSISVGVLSPSDADTRHRAGSALLLGEVRYALPAKSVASRTVLAVTAAHVNKRYEGSSIYSGTAGQVFSLTPGRSPLAARTGYVGLGAGLYGMDLQFVHAFVRVGAYAEAGYNFDSRLFVNAQGRAADRGNGASLALGVRL